jgi:selT/selW/selH-like putative selenoprotein
LAAEIKKATGVAPTLTKSSGGVFEVTVNGTLVYSKKATKRFPKKGEVLNLLKKENFPKKGDKA